MQRSGSTYAFNVARDVLRARGRIHQEASSNVLDALARAGDSEHLILKAHDADQICISLARHGAMRTICTIRRVEDSVASWIETFGFSEAESIEAMRAWCKLYEIISPFALTIPYSLIDIRPHQAARKIARYLVKDATYSEVKLSADQHKKAIVKRTADKLSKDNMKNEDIGFSFFNKETFSTVATSLA